MLQPGGAVFYGVAEIRNRWQWATVDKFGPFRNSVRTYTAHANRAFNMIQGMTQESQVNRMTDGSSTR